MNTVEHRMDVWLRFADNSDDMAEAEANTYRTAHGQYRVDWYLNAAGLVKSSPVFDTYEQACAWLRAEGFEDFTS